MHLSDFDYNLPEELIAQYPLLKRDEARLMVLNRREQAIEHRCFRDIAAYIGKNDLLVLNDTRVLSARLFGVRPSGGKVEVLLLSRKSSSVFDALVRPGRVRIGDDVIFNGGTVRARVTAANEISFNTEDASIIYGLGVMPLPPYIKRKPQEQDSVYYQTIYARHEGAVASPTAGLHFTQELLSEVESAGAKIACLTLHVGHGTFKPVKEEDITRHKMEEEPFDIPQETLALLEDTRIKRGRVFATGTTSLRALETYAARRISRGYTDLFVYPGYEFLAADCLITNFHLPRTTLFMLACAFAGEKFVKLAYREAIGKKYRFYSYGDAMLII